jgi:glycosyltransferase involved in cell wall biosynthesis
MTESVAVVLACFPLGGAERQAFEFIEAGVERGHDIQMLNLMADGNSRTIRGVKIRALNCEILHLQIQNRLIRRIYRYLGLIKLFKIFRKEKFDTIVFFSPIFLPLAWALSFTSTRVIFSIREFDRRLFRGIKYQLLRGIDQLITNTPSVKQELLSNGTSCALFLNFTSKPQLADISKGSSVPVKPGSEQWPILMVISNLEPHKRLHVLLQATIGMNFRIVVCGKLSNSAYYQACLKLASSSTCEVMFLGSVGIDSIYQILDLADILVHASVIEGTSNAILDALKMGKPVIASDIPENAYLVDGHEDFLFSADNAESLKKRIEITLSRLHDSEFETSISYLTERIDRKFSRRNLDEMIEFLFER